MSTIVKNVKTIELSYQRLLQNYFYKNKPMLVAFILKKSIKNDFVIFTLIIQ